jgi:integrase
MPKLRDYSKIESRLYRRTRGGPGRYYADFRDFSDVGGDQEALTPAGERFATADRNVAIALAEARLAQLKGLRDALPKGDAARRQFGPFARRHLRVKAVNEDAREPWLCSAEKHLTVARDYFGDKADLALIGVGEVTDYVMHLRERSNGRGGTLSAGAINQYLNSLSNLFRRAISEGVVPRGHNPVEQMISRPKIERTPTAWLEIAEMALVLEWARTYQPARADLAIPFVYELLMCYAHTGAREDEILGLGRTDVDLARRVITIRPNAWRDVKNKNAERTLPIPTDLHEALVAYEAGPHAPSGGLYFPTYVDGKEQMITDLRKMLDKAPMPERLRRPRTAAELRREQQRRQRKVDRLTGKIRTGPLPKESLAELQAPIDPTIIAPLRTRMIRHTWCAARLQTTDNGRPIAHYTVMVEMGHRDLELIKKIYGHLGRFRRRGEEVTYRPLAVPVWSRSLMGQRRRGLRIPRIRRRVPAHAGVS